MRELRSDSTTSRFSSPGIPKICSTPSASSALTNKSEPLGISHLYDLCGSLRNCRACHTTEYDSHRGEGTCISDCNNQEASMYKPDNVKTSPDYPIPEKMKAWVLMNPGELRLADKAVPVPRRGEVLLRIDAVAICATDLEVIAHGVPAMIGGGLPFNKNFTPGHEYMGMVVGLGPGVDEFDIGNRVTVEIHAGCGQCKRCRQGMYTSCHNYGLNYGDVDKGHRANGFTTDGGFA